VITAIKTPITEIKRSLVNHCNLSVNRCNQCKHYFVDNAP